MTTASDTLEADALPTADYSVACDLCGSMRRTEILEAKLFGSGGVFVCDNCGFVYVPVRRESDAVAESWNQCFGDGYTAQWPGVIARLTYVAELFDQKRGWTHRHVMEIGAGEGEFLSIVKNRGALTTHGIEPSVHNVVKLRARGHIAYQGTIEQYAKNRTYYDMPPDVIAILWTLENCTDCIGMLKKARTMLTVGGTLIVATGSRLMVPFKKPLGSYFSKNPPDMHCFRFSAKSLARALMAAGFNHIEFNDYTQRDELVAFARISAKPDPVYLTHDDPDDVRAFFRRWSEQWP